jgi:FlaA1/EpsC-like NDP-sugar epimerase
LHAVDISENNLVELVRLLRSSVGYIDGEFKCFALDVGSHEFEALIENSCDYDYVINLSAMKHVRSEKDPYSLMRMIRTNILNTINSLRLVNLKKKSHYFCVSTDKAANPVNMMGASKRIMELFLAREAVNHHVTTARFANVAFSDGSLLDSFKKRFFANQPIAAPNDSERYFVTPTESGELCMLSAILGDNLDTFFPKLKPNFGLIKFSDIAVRFLEQQNFEPVICLSEDEARSRVHELIPKKKWPVYFFETSTTGEKGFEEFHRSDEVLDLSRFDGIGVIKNQPKIYTEELKNFEITIDKWMKAKHFNRSDIIELFNSTIPEFNHKDTGKFLDDRM